MAVEDEVRRSLDEFRSGFFRLRDEVGKVIVRAARHHRRCPHSLRSPGAMSFWKGCWDSVKTLLVRTLADALTLKFQRIQFTLDLMPADVIGTNVVLETPKGRRKFEFQNGPIFANLVLADEINAQPPRRSRRCLRQCRSDRSPSRDGRIRCNAPSSCSLPRTRWKWREPTLCRKPSSIGSSSSC